MGDVKGFLKHDRQLPTRRPVPVRILDWNEVYEEFPEGHLQDQAEPLEAAPDRELERRDPVPALDIARREATPALLAQSRRHKRRAPTELDLPPNEILLDLRVVGLLQREAPRA